ncbi:MAG TPA: glycosyl hydrolase [Streptosporangiaceae bacterium]|nr:glycosyl hydrolase [Streptosporangiaceae bacterium]
MKQSMAAVLGSVMIAAAVGACSPGPPAASAARRLIQPGDSKTNCIYLAGTGSALMSSLRATERAAGVTYSCLETFIDNSPTWASWDSPWIDHSRYGFTSWIAAGPGPRELVISMNLIPDSEKDIGNPLGWETRCAAGQFNGYAATLARNLVAAGFGSSVIRLGKEMNGNWENDFMGTTAQEQKAWARCFAQEVTAMRSVAGSHFLFDWNVNACIENYPLSQWYPGNAYVDIIGVDIYDSFCSGQRPVPSAAAFQQLAAEPDGLNAVQAFAAQLGKPMSIPEWGTDAAGDGGLGDDPYYVQGIGAYVHSNNVAFQAYFSPNHDGIIPLSYAYPNTLSAYRQSFAADPVPTP